MHVDQLLALLVVSTCATTLALWFTWHLWHPPKHMLPAAAAGMACAVLCRLVLELLLQSNPLFADYIWSVAPELALIFVPAAGATLGVGAWRAFEVWHEQDMTVAGVFGFDEDTVAPKPVAFRSGGGHDGLRTHLKPSHFGARARKNGRT
jgi:hypothetical protein